MLDVLIRTEDKICYSGGTFQHQHQFIRLCKMRCDHPEFELPRLQIGIPRTGNFTPIVGPSGDSSPDVDRYVVGVETGKSYIVELVPDTADELFVAHFQDDPTGRFRVSRRGYEESSKFLSSVVTSFCSSDLIVLTEHVFAPVSVDYQITVSEYEIPASAATRISATIGELKFNFLETPGDRDFFSYELIEGLTYEFNLLGISSGAFLPDPFLWLHSEDLQVVAFDNNSGVGTDARITFTAPSTGTYFLSAGGAFDTTGFYEIHSRVAAYDDDAPLGTDTQVRLDFTPNQSKAFAGEIEISTDIDWMKIDMVKGRWYQVGVQSENGQNFLVRDANNDVQTFVASQGNSTSTFYQAKETGTHHLIVRDGEPGEYVAWVVDNFVPNLYSVDHFVLTETQTANFRDLFDIESTAVSSDLHSIQIHSEVAFGFDETYYGANEVHTFSNNDLLDQLEFNGNGAVSIRGLAKNVNGESYSTAWTSATLRTEPGPFRFLNIDKQWDELNTQRENEKEITIRFPETAPSYFEAGRFTGVQPVSSHVEQAIRMMFRDTGTQLRFINEETESADIQIFSADQDFYSVGYEPGMYGLGDIVLDNEFYSGDAQPLPGSREYFELLKAVATALGMRHFSSHLNRSESVVGFREDESGHPEVYPETFGYYDNLFFYAKYGAGFRYGYDSGYSFTSDTRPFKRTSFNAASVTSSNVNATQAIRGVNLDLRAGESSYLIGDGPWQSYLNGKHVFRTTTTARGSDFNDRINGNDYTNRLHGGSGDDWLRGFRGNDELDGGIGDDTYYFESGDGQDLIQDNQQELSGGGVDTLVIKGQWGLDDISKDVTFQRLGDRLVLNLDMNGEFNKSVGEISIAGMANSETRIERLELQNFSRALDVYSLSNVWDLSTFEKQRFRPTGERDEFGLTLAPVS